MPIPSGALQIILLPFYPVLNLILFVLWQPFSFPVVDGSFLCASTLRSSEHLHGPKAFQFSSTARNYPKDTFSSNVTRPLIGRCLVCPPSTPQFCALTETGPAQDIRVIFDICILERNCGREDGIVVQTRRTGPQ